MFSTKLAYENLSKIKHMFVRVSPRTGLQVLMEKLCPKKSTNYRLEGVKEENANERVNEEKGHVDGT